MTISTTDIKLRTPERLTDLADGGQWRQKWVVTAAPEPGVPEAVYAYQLRRALREASKLAAMRAYVAALPDNDEKDFWQFAHEIKRRSKYMASMRAAIGMNNAQMDTAFFTAANYDS